MLIRAIAALISTACLLALVFTDLTITQRLLLVGVIVLDAVDGGAGIIARRNKSRRHDAH